MSYIPVVFARGRPVSRPWGPADSCSGGTAFPDQSLLQGLGQCPRPPVGLLRLPLLTLPSTSSQHLSGRWGHLPAAPRGPLSFWELGADGCQCGRPPGKAKRAAAQGLGEGGRVPKQGAVGPEAYEARVPAGEPRSEKGQAGPRGPGPPPSCCEGWHRLYHPQPLQLQLSISGGLSRRGSGSHALLPHSAHHSLRLPSGSGWGGGGAGDVGPGTRALSLPAEPFQSPSCPHKKGHGEFLILF